MEQYIKKYFGWLPVIVVICCAVLAAKAANHIVEQKALPDSSKVGKAKALVPKAGSSNKPKKKRSKKGEPVAKRNMFCSECVPATEEVATGGDSNSPPLTSLPLRLLATNVSAESDEASFATILNTSTERQGAYGIGQDIHGNGEILRIMAKYVDFKNPTSSRVERLSLVAESPRAEPSPTPSPFGRPSPPRPSRGPQNELLSMVDEGVNKISPTEFELDKKVVDKVLENPMAVAKGARIVPSIKNGKANGFKLYAIRPSSLYAKIGLVNGDTIHSINGFDLTSPDKALEVYTKLREATSLSVNATRRGKPVTINYTIK